MCVPRTRTYERVKTLPGYRATCTMLVLGLTADPDVCKTFPTSESERAAVVPPVVGSGEPIRASLTMAQDAVWEAKGTLEKYESG